MNKKHGFLLLCVLSCTSVFTLLGQSFSFGTGTHLEGTCAVSRVQDYSDSLGSGFEFYDDVELKTSCCTSSQPFYFSVKVPEGVYKVDVVLGSDHDSSITTVKAESRRLMFNNEKVNIGDRTKKTFIVDVRSPRIDEVRRISLKKRELNYLNWDDRLSLEFLGKKASVRSISITPYSPHRTLFLAGNSTVTDQDCSPWASWGQLLTAYLDTNIVVANYAESGESLASFKSAGRLDKILSKMNKGDYLFIEFGHNDQKRKGEGIGPWESFSDLLVLFVSRTRAHGGIPVFVTPTQRRSFNADGFITLTHGEYPAAMRQVAKDLNVPYIDVHKKTKVLYETWGVEASKNAFVHYPAHTFPGQEKALNDNTHFNEFGANEIAKCVLQGIIDLDLSIAHCITDKTFTYDPTSPDVIASWLVPMSPRVVSVKPDGN